MDLSRQVWLRKGMGNRLHIHFYSSDSPAYNSSCLIVGNQRARTVVFTAFLQEISVAV